MKRETSNPKPATQKTATSKTPPGYRPEPKTSDAVKRGEGAIGGSGYDNRSDAERERG